MAQTDDDPYRWPKQRGRIDDSEVGRLLRGAVRAISGFERREIAEVEWDFSQAIGVNSQSFPRYYKGKNKIDDHMIKQVLRVVAERPRRAYLDRAWAKDLVSAARRECGLRFLNYDPDRLIDELWPPAVSAQAPASNLPVTTYAKFVYRAEPFVAVIEGLRQPGMVVMIIGMGGIGKTSLAREVADRCLRRADATSALNDEVPAFDAVVWVSDTGQPGSTTLDTLLNEIACTLDSPGYTRLEPAHKRLQVEQLLHNQRVLLVVDNVETVQDDNLFTWLLRMRGSSKALITTREDRYLSTDYVWRVDLGRMSYAEGQQFIDLRSRALALPIVPDAATQDLLIDVTGGNPRAIELFLGLARRSGRAVADLARSFQSDIQAQTDPAVSDVSMQLFNLLFKESWMNLDLDERQVMLALALLPDSVADQVLAHVAGVEPRFHRIIQQLAGLSFIETEQQQTAGGGYHPRRGLHPLTRQFVTTQLAAEPDFATAARDRWLHWAVEHATTYGGHRPNDLTALGRINAEEPVLRAALECAAQQQRHADVVQLVRNLEFFYYLRARWDKKYQVHAYYIAAATALNDLNEQVSALTMHIIMLSRQGLEHAARPYLEDLQRLEQAEMLRGSLFFNTRHAQALCQRACGDLDAAARAWQDVLDQQAEREVSARLVAGTKHWLGLCRFWQGQYEQAHQLLTASLDAALEQQNDRRAARNRIALALLELERDQIEAARQYIPERYHLARGADDEQRAHLLYVQGRLQAAEGDAKAARTKLNEALELFERMGLEAETSEARTALAEIEQGEHEHRRRTIDHRR